MNTIKVQFRCENKTMSATLSRLTLFQIKPALCPKTWSQALKCWEPSNPAISDIYPSIDQETSLKFSRTKVKQLKTAIERCETYSFTVLNNYGLFYPSWERYKFQSLREVSKVNETDETLLTMGAESSLRIFLPFFFFFPFKIPFSLIYNEITIYYVTVSYG